MSEAVSLMASGGRVSLLVAVVLLLGGCVVGPDYRTPFVEVPEQWSTVTADQPDTAPDLAQWWTRLDDPLLDELIAQAVEGNLDVATAKAKIREARATLRQTTGAQSPSVDGSASGLRSDNDASGTGSVYEAGFDAAWEIDLFGGTRRAVEAATYGVDFAEDELRATLLTLIGDVAANYVEARGYQARIELAGETAAAQDRTAALTRAMFEAGSASAVDVAKAEAVANSANADMLDYQASFAESVHRLSVLLGRDPAALMRTLQPPAPIPVPAFPLPKGVPADILLARPDVRMAERQLAQSTALIGEAEAALYPSVSLIGAVSLSAATPGDLAQGSSIGWSFGPALSVPIFNGGQLEAAVDVTEAQRDQSYIAFRAAVLTALEDVENASVALSQERQRADVLTVVVGQYDEAAVLSRTLFESGSTSFLDVLDAERSLYSAQDALLQSRIAITIDYISLAKALGGGWDGAIDASRPEVVDQNTGPRLASQD